MTYNTDDRPIISSMRVYRKSDNDQRSNNENGRFLISISHTMDEMNVYVMTCN
jgi:hypothetical protein